MGYIMEMRAIIGNKPLMIVGTSVIAYKDGSILLQKRADNGQWGYPGGCMEMGEDTEASAKREFEEETGMIANNLKLYGVFAGERRHYFYPNGHEVYITDVVYTCSDFKESGHTHDDEVLDVKWFSIYDLPENITYTTRDIIEKFVSDYEKSNI